MKARDVVDVPRAYEARLRLLSESVNDAIAAGEIVFRSGTGRTKGEGRDYSVIMVQVEGSAAVSFSLTEAKDVIVSIEGMIEANDCCEMHRREMEPWRQMKVVIESLLHKLSLH